MSFDVYFAELDRSLVTSVAEQATAFHDVMADVERMTGSERAFSTEDDDLWSVLKAGVSSILPGAAAEEDGQRRSVLCKERTIEIILHPGEPSISVSLDLQRPVDDVADDVVRLASFIEDRTGLVALDATGPGFLLPSGQRDLAPRLASARRRIGHALHPAVDLGLSFGRWIALTDEEMKHLRATKGDRARRALVDDEMLRVLPLERVLATGQNYMLLHAALRAEHGNLLGDDQLSICVGQQMHKGSARWIMRLKALDALVAALGNLDRATIEEVLLTFEPERFESSSVPFWTKEVWERDRLTAATVLTNEVRIASAGAAFDKLRGFLTMSSEAGHEVIFWSNNDYAPR